MGISWYSGIDDSGTQSVWDNYKAWLEQNKPGRGKYDKELMKSPETSAVARAANAGAAHAMRLADQSYTVDPEIAQNAPEVLAQQINRRKQDIASGAFTDYMGAIAGALEGAANRGAQRRMGIYQTQANAGLQNLLERGRMMQGIQKRSPWAAIAGAAAPFLSLIPGVGPALSAGVGAAARA